MEVYKYDRMPWEKSGIVCSIEGDDPSGGGGDGPTTPEPSEDEYVLDDPDDPDDDPDPDDDDDDDQPRQTRRQKKRNRYKEVVESNNALKEEVAQLRQQVQQPPQQQPVPQPQPQQQPQVDPLEQEETELYARQEQLFESYNARSGKLTKEEEAEYKKNARKIDGRLKEIAAERVILKRAPRQEDIQRNAMQNMIRANHGDVYTNPNAVNWARARHAQHMAEGRQDSMALVDEVMDEARQKFNMKPRNVPKPNEATKRRLSGTPKGATAAPGSSGQRKVFKMEEHHKVMADQLYQHIDDPKERYRKYANEVGRKLIL